MTPEQEEGIARAERKIAPAMRLYELRNRISHTVGKLTLDELEEMVRILDLLTEYELSQVARFAQGLANFRSAAQESEDAPGLPSRSPADAKGDGG
jgi:hypothetical protein